MPIKAMNIDKLISEAISNYLNENIILEKKSKKKKAKEKDKKKKGKKLKGGIRADFDIKADKATNPNLNNKDSKELADILDSPYINLAAVARDAEPQCETDQGAQSMLRKKVKHLKSDSGSTYKIKKKEANRIRKAIIKNLP